MMRKVSIGFLIKTLTLISFSGQSDSETDIEESEAQILIENTESKPVIEINESKEQ